MVATWSCTDSAGLERGADFLLEAAEALDYHCCVEFFLRPELAIDAALADSRARGDFVDQDAFEFFLREQQGSAMQDALAQKWRRWPSAIVLARPIG